MEYSFILHLRFIISKRKIDLKYVYTVSCCYLQTWFKFLILPIFISSFYVDLVDWFVVALVVVILFLLYINMVQQSLNLKLNKVTI